MGNVRKRKRVARPNFAETTTNTCKLLAEIGAELDARNGVYEWETTTRLDDHTLMIQTSKTIASHSVDNARTRRLEQQQQRLLNRLDHIDAGQLLDQLLNDATLARHYADLLDYAQAQDRKANADYERELLGQALWQQRETHLPPPIPKHQLRSITSLDPPTHTRNTSHRANLGYVVGLMPQIGITLCA